MRAQGVVTPGGIGAAPSAIDASNPTLHVPSPYLCKPGFLPTYGVRTAVPGRSLGPMPTIELVVPDAAGRRQRAFIALALAGGNAERAAERCDASARSIRRWRDSHGEEYERVRRDLAPQIEATVLAECHATAVRLGEIERLAAEKLAIALENDQIPAKDLPSALQRLTTAKAINIDKILVMSGRPTQVVEHRSAAELVRRLARLGAVIDGSAEEVTEAAT